MGSSAVDGTLVVQLMNFAIFFVVFNVVFLRPVAGAIAKRRRVHQQPRLQITIDTKRKREACAPRRKPFASRPGEKRSISSRSRELGRRTKRPKISRRYAQQAQRHRGSRARTRAESELDEARAGESEAVRRLSELMLRAGRSRRRRQ